MLKKTLSALIILFWLVMLGLLVERSYLRPSTVIALDAVTDEGVRTGEEWSGIYQQGRKIGYARSRTTLEADTYHLLQESELDLLVLGQVQRVRTVINSYTTKNFYLKYFDFELTSDQSSMKIKGAVLKNQLVLDIMTGGQTKSERIPLKEPPYLTPNIKPAILLLGLEPGKKFRFPVFNPATMHTEDAVVLIESKERIKVGDSEQTVYKVKEIFQGMEAVAWVTEQGETLREESPLGYVLLKETRGEALKRDKKGPVVDILSLVMIPSRPIENAGKTIFLRARLGGTSVQDFALNSGNQSFSNDIIEVGAPASIATYTLPYPGGGQAAELAPTALVQSDDPAIIAQARKILGMTADARGAAAAINAWVYESIEKRSVVSIPSAIEVLNQRVGDCNEHTVLYTALARAAGIPTRMAGGIVYMKNGFYYHAWPEVWLGAWTAVDPTFNQFPADATHIRFVIGGLDRQSEILKLVGKLNVDVLEYH